MQFNPGWTDIEPRVHMWTCSRFLAEKKCAFLWHLNFKLKLLTRGWLIHGLQKLPDGTKCQNMGMHAHTHTHTHSHHNAQTCAFEMGKRKKNILKTTTCFHPCGREQEGEVRETVLHRASPIQCDSQLWNSSNENHTQLLPWNPFHLQFKPRLQSEAKPKQGLNSNPSYSPKEHWAQGIQEGTERKGQQVLIASALKPHYTEPH